MNERIRELALLATDTVEIVNPDTGIAHHREFFDQEKFAELIIQECCSAIRLNDVFFGGKFQGAILKHFGVEE
jgi:hypothetical protein